MNTFKQNNTMGGKILMLTDFSQHSWSAIQYAIKLHEKQDCDFYILNTYIKDTDRSDNIALLHPDESFNKITENRSQKGLGDILERLSKQNLDKNKNHNFHVMSRCIPLLEVVNELVYNLGIHLIVMGTKGISNAQEGKYGKNTLRVIKNVQICPVLVVPKSADFNHPREIMLAIDSKMDFKIAEIKYVAELAKINNTKIRVLGMLKKDSLILEQNNNKQLLQPHFKGIEHCFNTVYDQEGLRESLSHFSKEGNNNIISFIVEKPSFWGRMGFGTTQIGKLGYYENTPILALKGQERYT